MNKLGFVCVLVAVALSMQSAYAFPCKLTVGEYEYNICSLTSPTEYFIEGESILAHFNIGKSVAKPAGCDNAANNADVYIIRKSDNKCFAAGGPNFSTKVLKNEGEGYWLLADDGDWCDGSFHTDVQTEFFMICDEAVDNVDPVVYSYSPSSCMTQIALRSKHVCNPSKVSTYTFWSFCWDVIRISFYSSLVCVCCCCCAGGGVAGYAWLNETDVEIPFADKLPFDINNLFSGRKKSMYQPVSSYERGLMDNDVDGYAQF